MGIRMSGLVSGLDTESIVSELVKAEATRKQKVEQNKTKLEWKQEIWKDLNKEIYSFYTDKVSKLRLQGQYTVKSVTSTDESKVTASAAQGAVPGNYSLKVKQLSAAQNWTSARFGAQVSADSSLADLGIEEGTVFRLQSGISDKGSGNYVTFEVTAESKLSDFLSACNNAGISATYDKEQQRLFIGSKQSGADNKFEISAYSPDSAYAAAMDGLKEELDFSGRTTAEKKNILNAVGVLTKYSENEAFEKLENEEWTQEEYDAYVSNRDAAMEYLENFGDYSRIQTAIDGIYSSRNEGVTDALAALKLTPESGATIIEARDSVIEYNGVEYTSGSNDFNINNVKMTVKNLTDSNGVTLTVGNDTESAMKMVKDFITTYNGLIDKMSTLYNAKAAKGYEPLSEEEKKAMSDEQVKLWEDKIKATLLRRDESVSSLLTSMRTALATSVTVDGKKYSLANFGISTSSDYKEYGKLHIYGDEEDAKYADKEKKLEKALEEDPETVAKVLSGVVQNLYTTLNKSMQASTLRSAMSFYNDKEATKQVKQYEKDIEKWKEKLEDMEDRYYSQFTAMEKAMSSMKSQSSYLSGMMGGGQ